MKWWVEFAAVAFAFLVLIAVFAAPLKPDGIDFSAVSENVTGGAPRLAAGSALEYALTVGGVTSGATVRALGARGTCAAFSQQTAGMNLTFCFSGAEARVFGIGGELPAESAALARCYAFEPWMADAAANWSASTTYAQTVRGGELSRLNLSEETVTFYSFEGTETVRGRTALKVAAEIVQRRMSAHGAEERVLGNRTVWVDAETRVVLRENATLVGMAYASELVAAPFALENQTDAD